MNQDPSQQPDESSVPASPSESAAESESAAQTPTGGDENQRKNWLIGLHASPLAGLTSIPFANIIAPLVLWLMKREQIPALDADGRKVLNFQISVAIYFLVSLPLVCVIIGYFLLLAVAIFWLVCVIIGTIKAANGESFDYPLSIPFLQPPAEDAPRGEAGGGF